MVWFSGIKEDGTRKRGEAGKREAVFWSPMEKERWVRCGLCNHRCPIPPGKTGICRVRKNEEGRLYTLIYGMASSVAVDPIEKKPLFHFKPGSTAFSLGTVGCNFRCLHCQNNDISMADPSFPFLRKVTPEEVVEGALATRSESIAWTYNEPTIWYEFTLETSRLAKKEGISAVYVTNGYMTEEALREHRPYLDAMNIDVKAFTEEFYKKVVGARLEPVLRTCENAVEMGIHVEITYLVIPGWNDRREEIKQFSEWVVEALGEDIPVHFSRFYPQYKMTDRPPTPLSTLDMAYNVAKDAGVKYVYLGNVPGDHRENTYCPSCGELLIERVGFAVSVNRVKNGRCPRCGEKIPVHG